MPHRPAPLSVVGTLVGAGLLACAAPEAPPPVDSRPAAATPSPAPVTSIDTPAADNGPALYHCDNGDVIEVRFGYYDATVRLADDTTLTLPRAQSASMPGSDVYVGRAIALEREGDRLRLTRDGEASRCGRQAPGAS